MAENVIEIAESDDAAESTLFGMRTAISELPRSVLWVRWITIILGAGFFFWGLTTHKPISWGPVWLFALALLVTEYFLSLETAPNSRLHLGYTFLMLYFQLMGGVAAATMYAVVRAIEWTISRLTGREPRPLLSGAFDVAIHIVAVYAAVLITQALLGIPMLAFSSGLRPVATMTVFAIAFLLCHTLLTSIAVYARYGFSDVRTQLWPTTMLWMAIALFLSIPFAVVSSFLSQSLEPVEAIAIIFALVAVVSAIARLNGSLRETNHALRVVNEIGNAVNSTLSKEELRSIVARETVGLIDWDRFYFATINEERSRMEITFLDKEGREIASTETPIGIGMTGQALTTGEIVHYEREPSDDSGLSDFEASVGTSPPRSLLAVPLRFADEKLGVIGFQSRQRDAYGQRIFKLAEMVADQTAVALRNSQLFESEERANRERDEFLGVVTHEIKSPLTSVKGYTELAADSIRTNDGEGAIQSLEVVREEAGKILRLVEDLLDASKMDGGKFSVEMGSADLSKIVKGAVDRFSRTTDHRVTFNADQEMPPIKGDEQRLSQVVENLLSNAIKYSPGGKSVVATLRRTPETIDLLVSDQGDGIAEDLLPHVFDRFYRVHEGGASTPKGTGLGLYITRQIVRTHGGSIEVESEVGVGTTFIVSLPLESGW